MASESQECGRAQWKPEARRVNGVDRERNLASVSRVGAAWQGVSRERGMAQERRHWQEGKARVEEKAQLGRGEAEAVETVDGAWRASKRQGERRE